MMEEAPPPMMEEGPPMFIAMGVVGKHDGRSTARDFLQKEAVKLNSNRLARVANAIAAENPFTGVLKEIDNMLVVIKEEGKADKEKLDWCNDERGTNDASHAEKVAEIEELENTITTLKNVIGEPETGLIDLLAADRASLDENRQNALAAFKTRSEENALYKQNIINGRDVQELINSAAHELRLYYKRLAEEKGATEHAEMTLTGEDSAVVGTGEGFSDGQGANGEKAIKLLEGILDDSLKEEAEIQKDEHKAHDDFEELSADLEQTAKTLEKNIVRMTDEKAQKEKELLQAENDNKQTKADKKAIENYLKSIKAGCDFITEHFDHRESSRADESAALENAISLLKDTPAYKTAVANQHQEDLGECADTCNENTEEHVKCKACLAKTSVPGYCAGHADTVGC